MDTLKERFWAKVAEPDGNGCMLWTASTTTAGRGQIQMKCEDGKYRPRSAQRVAWLLAYGDWPEHTIHHLCYQPLCMNVDHMQDLTTAENTADMAKRGRHHNTLKTHCPKGHEYTDENTRYGTRSNGKVFRICKACDLAYFHRKRGPEPLVHGGKRRTVPREPDIDPKDRKSREVKPLKVKRLT